jgi:hypothetical protein
MNEGLGRKNLVPSMKLATQEEAEKATNQPERNGDISRLAV